MTPTLSPSLQRPSASALEYPFDVPERHFLLCDGEATHFGGDAIAFSSQMTLQGLLTGTTAVSEKARSLIKVEPVIGLLSCGSNASPTRLAEKLARVHSPWALGLKMELDGWVSCYAATLSKYGAVPATFADASGQTSYAHLIITAARNLPALIHSETGIGNYDLYELTDTRHTIRDLPVYAFLSRFGPLIGPSSSPIALPQFATPHSTLAGWTQAEVLDWALKDSRISLTPDAFVATGEAAPEKEALRARLRARRQPVGMSGFALVRFPPPNRVQLGRSGDHKRRSTHYEAWVTPGLRKRLGLGSHAVLAFVHPGLQRLRAPEDESRLDYLAAICRVRVANVEDDIVRVDQTLRTALGIPHAPFGDLHNLPVYLLPARRSLWKAFRQTAAGLFGYRTLAMRCAIAAVEDIEKRYARLSESALRTLGLAEGADVILERAFPETFADGMIHAFTIKDIRLSAFSATDAFIADRKGLAQRFPHRYIDVNRALFDYDNFVRTEHLDAERAADKAGVSQGRRAEDAVWEPDLPPIFLDSATRAFASKRGAFNKANAFSVLQVRRSVTSALGRDIVQVGLAFSMTFIQFTLAFAALFPEAVEERKWQIGLYAVPDWGVVSLIFVMCLLVTAGYMIVRLRQQI